MSDDPGSTPTPMNPEQREPKERPWLKEVLDNVEAQIKELPAWLKPAPTPKEPSAEARAEAIKLLGGSITFDCVQDRDKATSNVATALDAKRVEIERLENTLIRELETNREVQQERDTLAQQLADAEKRCQVFATAADNEKADRLAWQKELTSLADFLKCKPLEAGKVAEQQLEQAVRLAEIVSSLEPNLGGWENDCYQCGTHTEVGDIPHKPNCPIVLARFVPLLPGHRADCRQGERTNNMSGRLPEWFVKEASIAIHKDTMNAWPWWGRVLHRWLISWRCPCCKEIRRRKWERVKQGGGK